MDPKELQKKIDDAVTAATADLTKKLTAATDAIAKMGADNKKKPQASDTTDAEPDADDATAKAWRAYTEKKVAKAIADTKAEIEKKATEDEVIKVGDTEFHKSQTDPGTFAVIKAQQKQIADGIEKAEIAEFTKTAETTYRHLPGEPLVKAKALRSVSKIGEEDRKALDAMLKAGEAAMTAALKAKGADTGATDGTASADLQKMAEAHMAEKKVSKHIAMAAVLETEAGKALYKRSLEETGATAH